METRVSTRKALALGVAVVCAIPASCREPTEITLDLSTDVSCGDLSGTAIATGPWGRVKGGASTMHCEGAGKIGTLVLVPSGGAGDQIEIEVASAVGPGVSADACLTAPGPGCIVARRRLRYVPHTPLRLPIEMSQKCLGVVSCAPDQTCVEGACASSTIDDPGRCAGNGCDEGILPLADGGATEGGATEGGAPDAADGSPPPPEAGPDGGAPFARLSAGDNHTCAITQAGGVRCWGNNQYGQIGNGTRIDAFAPVDVVSLGGIATAVVGGSAHTCALLSTGGVRCWGDNAAGQLGDGTTTERDAPVDVLSLGGTAIQLAAGLRFTCARLSTGTVRCWGENSNGWLGDGTTTPRTAPVDVVSLSGVASISTGGSHTCALLSTGALKCWGDNTYGQLGDGTQNSASAPVDVTSLNGTAVQVSGGGYHTCALLTGGKLRCWGNNLNGQLGNGSPAQAVLLPTDVVSLGGTATQMSAGHGWHTCALLSTGALRCWGQNGDGQLGDGTTSEHSTPVDVVSLGGQATLVTGGSGHTCALLSTGAVRCWGYDTYGALGDGTATPGAVPTPVSVVGFP